jgi:UrcA family protein
MARLHIRRVPVLSASIITIAAAAALSFAAAAVPSDQQPEVRVQASGKVTHERVGTTYSGEPIEQLQLNRGVGYRDLNLNTPAGVQELERRIRYTAREACQQLRSLYPIALWRDSNADCVNEATQSAMAQLPAAVASAKQASAQPR